MASPAAPPAPAPTPTPTPSPLSSEEEPIDPPPPLEAPGSDPDPASTSDSDDDPAPAPSAAAPSDPAAAMAAALVHKNAGNAHFKAGDYARAGRAYRKGHAAVSSLNYEGDDALRSLLLALQTNLSAVCMKRDRPEQSRDVAGKALAIDPGNVKALYRRAVAHRKLGDYGDSCADLRAALERDPVNREVRREMVAVRKAMKSEREKREKEKKAIGTGFGGLYNDKEEEVQRAKDEKRKKKEREKDALKTRKARWEDDCVKLMGENKEAISYEDWDKETKKVEETEKKEKEKKDMVERDRRRRAMEAARAASGDDDGDDDEDDDLGNRESVRGYKMTSDGKKTSYFTHEQTKEEAALLGSIAPKRLDAPSGGAEQEQRSPRPAEGSAWNQARTWEEKNTSAWCTGRLREQLGEAVGSDGTDRYIGVVSKVKEVSGDASFATASGKKRYIFDYKAELKFRIMDGAGGDAAVPASVADVAVSTDGDGGADGGNDDDDKEKPTEEGSERVVAKGVISLPDICSTIDDGDYEVQVTWSKRPPGAEAGRAADACKDELVASVKECIMKFVLDFNQQY
eukprot:CAMPEP_0194266586 /NCGR_PEP_ID=MMETSP0169-20130528/1444_1 /TAXON_ID=218684 /ORGANISM="Corethron pennatum, Strain L29A3" /LENGTH=570 /DNA_ID=CAMNT_0039007305 /DNA_START=65 /DNA_END=1777 /DNA_ORIENTATION=+